MELSSERTLLVVYFDKNEQGGRHRAPGRQGRQVASIDSRRTPSYGQDRTFIESIISSI